jgi:7-cyano-7-deazaguanine synthase
MKRCVVLLSGKQNSTISLFWAKNVFHEVHAITFNYGQNCSSQVDAAKIVADLANVVSHEIIDIPDLLEESSQEPTFSPLAHTIILTVAANFAKREGINELVTGVCIKDLGGESETRFYIDATEQAIGEAIALASNSTYSSIKDFKIHTPLIDMNENSIFELADCLPICRTALAFAYNGI